MDLQRRWRGFTVIESLVAMLLLGILLTLVLPLWQSSASRQQQQITRTRLLHYLEHARVQSVLSGTSHQVCGSRDGQRCDGDWSGYWLLMTADGRLLDRHRLPAGQQLCWRGITSVIRYLDNGTTALANGRFALCDGVRTHWQLVVNRQGRVREDSAGSSCCEARA